MPEVLVVVRKFDNFLKIMTENPNKKFALITIIQVEGSAYRHEGAKMLFDEHGVSYGTISAGCLESDLNYSAKEVIKTQKTKVVKYDLRSEDDAGWGQGAGCNGAVTLFLEPLQCSDPNSIWNTMKDYLDKGLDITCVKWIGNELKNTPNILTEETGLLDQNHELNNWLENDDLYKNNTFSLISTERLNRKILIENYSPKEKLIIFGAGPDVKPIVDLAVTLDFTVHIIDPREELNSRYHFPNASDLILEHPHVYLEKHKIPNHSYVIVMTHNFLWDKIIISNVITDPPLYLGVLGPKARTKRLIESDYIPKWIHSPIGLEINAEGAEEISVSIMAELIKLRNESNNIKNSNQFIIV